MAKFFDIIEYEGDNSTIVWKHPCENFTSLTQLIVRENQEAIFFSDGQALDTFGPGRHTLETHNLPLIGKAIRRPFGRKNIFQSEVYFINKSVQLGLKWGTDSRVRFVDPLTEIPLDIGASGEINLQVVDPRKLLVKLVGSASGAKNKGLLTSNAKPPQESQKTIQSYFRAPLMMEVKSYLATVIREQRISIFDVDSHMAEISNALKKRIAPFFEDFGLYIPYFYITTFSLPEEDKNFNDIKSLISQAYIGVKTEETKTSIAEAEQKRKLIEETTAAQVRVLKAQSEAEAKKAQGLADAEIMRAKGYTERDIIDADVQKAYAESMGKFGSNIGTGSTNNGAGGIANDFVNTMASLKIAENMFNRMESATASNSQTNTTTALSWDCICGEKNNTNNFCSNCGKAKPDSQLCPSCRNVVDAHAKFCSACGYQFATRCPSCGESISPNSHFCSACGAKI